MNDPQIISGSLSRRDVLKTIGAGAALLGLGLWNSSAQGATATEPSSGPFVLPPLPYAYDALEPHIDARTMEIHHDKHHKAYVDNANKALAGHPEFANLDGPALLKRLGEVPESIRVTLRNNLGGHLNHSLFWQILTPKANGAPSGDLAPAIAQAFGSFEEFKTRLTDAAMKRFGSGWAWLVATKGKLEVKSTANQDSPLLDGGIPILALDVWEHAYYLKHQNKRADYISAYWNVVNWEQADLYYKAALTA